MSVFQITDSDLGVFNNPNQDWRWNNKLTRHPYYPDLLPYRWITSQKRSTSIYVTSGEATWSNLTSIQRSITNGRPSKGWRMVQRPYNRTRQGRQTYVDSRGASSKYRRESLKKEFWQLFNTNPTSHSSPEIELIIYEDDCTILSTEYNIPSLLSNNSSTSSSSSVVI